MASTTDLTAHGAENPEHDSYDDQDYPDRVKDRNLGHDANDQQDETENDHETSPFG
jgi:hypothetical protein